MSFVFNQVTHTPYEVHIEHIASSRVEGALRAIALDTKEIEFNHT